MRPDRWSLVPTALGLILLAAWAADAHELVTSARDDDWSLFARAESAYLGGLWLLGGFAPRWARLSALGAFGCFLIHDLARAALGYPPRLGFAQMAVGPWWVLAGDLVVILALLRWRPAADAAPRLGSHPGRVAGAAAIAICLGMVINWTQIGRFPIAATARAGGSLSSPGLDYLVYLPDGYYRSPGHWPLILYLHGAGDMGLGLDRVRAGGLPRRLEVSARLPSLVVAPYCPKGSWDVAALDALLEEVLGRYAVDADRVYLTGLSMGGSGTWALAAAHPERFAAIAPICGGGSPAGAERLKGVPTWVFHGEEDQTVPVEESRRMVAALERAGGAARLTIYPRTGHDAWTKTYADPALYAWFLAHRRPAGASDGEAAPPPAPPHKR